MCRIMLTLVTLLVLAVSTDGADAFVSHSTLSHSNVVRSGTVVIPTDADVASPQHLADQIVVYSASWCQPCRRLHPVLTALKQEGYKVVHRDVDRDALKYKYRAVPTIYFVRENVVIKTTTGYRSKEQIKQDLMISIPRHTQKSGVDWN